MFRLRPMTMAIAACGFVIVSNSPYAPAQNQPEGKLFARSSEPIRLDLLEPLLRLGTTTLTNNSRSNTLTCDPRPPGPWKSVSSLQKNLGIESLSQLGVLVSPTRKDLGLHTFWLEIYARKNLVFRTKPECTGCSVTYRAIASAQSDRLGYVFVVDKDALAVANKFFVPENSIVLKVSGHNGARTTFTFFKVKG